MDSGKNCLIRKERLFSYFTLVFFSYFAFNDLHELLLKGLADPESGIKSLNLKFQSSAFFSFFKHSGILHQFIYIIQVECIWCYSLSFVTNDASAVATSYVPLLIFFFSIHIYFLLSLYIYIFIFFLFIFFTFAIYIFFYLYFFALAIGHAALTLRSRLRCIILRRGQEKNLPPSHQNKDPPDGGPTNDGPPPAKAPTNLLVLNEVVIDRGPSPYLSNLDLYLDGKRITSVQGDGE